MSKYKEFGAVTVSYNDPEWERVFGTHEETKISWACWGSVPIESAEQFMKDMNTALEFAKVAK